MAEYIRREDAIKCIEGQCVDGKMWGNYESEGTLIEAYSAIDDLMEIPSADVAQVKHGRWEGYSHSRYCGVDDFGDPIYKDGVVYYCSECMRKTVIKEKYCPSCGAKMDGGAD